MKKSNLILAITITIICACFGMINFKLSAEYKKKNILPSVKKVILPPFHHIKEIKSAIKEEPVYLPLINIYQQANSSLLTYYFYSPIGYEYFVKNDTLFLQRDSVSDGGLPVLNLYCNNLKSLSSIESQITLHHFQTDSLQLVSQNNSTITCVGLTNKYLNLSATNKSVISLSAVDTIHKAAIKVLNKSELKLSDAFFKSYTLSIDSTATISTTGKSLKAINTGGL